jgi:hypothetical protein
MVELAISWQMLVLRRLGVRPRPTNASSLAGSLDINCHLIVTEKFIGLTDYGESKIVTPEVGQLPKSGEPWMAPSQTTSRAQTSIRIYSVDTPHCATFELIHGTTPTKSCLLESASILDLTNCQHLKR